MLAVIRIAHDPRTNVHLAKQRANGKTKREAIRSLKRHLVRRVYHLLSTPPDGSQPRSALNSVTLTNFRHSRARSRFLARA